MGVLLPTFDKIHYFFLLDNCDMKTSQYDLLMLFPFVGLAAGTFIYMRCMRHMQARTVLQFSLLLRLLLNLVRLTNVERWNRNAGISDFAINVPLFLLDSTSRVCFASLPITLLIARVVPMYSISSELRYFGFLSAIFYASTEWLSELTGGLLAIAIGLGTDESKAEQSVFRVKYGTLVIIVFPMLIVMLLLSFVFIDSTDLDF